PPSAAEHPHCAAVAAAIRPAKWSAAGSYRAGLAFGMLGHLLERIVHFPLFKNAKLFQREQRRFLLSDLLIGSPGAGETPAVDANANFEALAVVGALLVEQFIHRRRAERLLGVLLKHRLVVVLMRVGGNRLD